jgi:signal transduction histidine kinase
MKQKLTELSQRYLQALRKYLKQGSYSNLRVAWQLGSEALALGTKVQGLNRIHERAFTLLQPLGQTRGKIKERDFLALATIPFGETHRGARGDKTAVNRPGAPVGRLKVNGSARPKNEHDKRKNLQISLRLQKRLRRQTHRVLAAQENERKQLSRDLQDEIAQSLLGINVRLLTLKKNARSNPTGLKKEIAGLQRLVARSVESMRRFARELEFHR